MFSKKLKFGVIVGLKYEKNTLKDLNVISDIGYGKDSAAATKKLLNSSIDCVISFGFAGSINSDLKRGQIILPDNIVWENNKCVPTSLKYRKYIKDLLNEFKLITSNLGTISNIINKQDQKKELSIKKNISAIDMESEFIQKEAIKKKVPFIALRVIFDDLELNIPDFIKKSSNTKGVINYKKVILNLILRPINFIQLIKLSINFFMCIKVLKKLAIKIFDI